MKAETELGLGLIAIGITILFFIGVFLYWVVGKEIMMISISIILFVVAGIGKSISSFLNQDSDPDHLREVKKIKEAQHDVLVTSKKQEIEKLEFEIKEAQLKEELGKIGKVEPPAQKPRQKSRADKINERAREEKIIKETIVKNKEKNLIDIEERAKREGLSLEEVVEKKDIVKAHWAKIEMEQLQKLEKKFG